MKKTVVRDDPVNCLSKNAEHMLEEEEGLQPD